MAQAVADSSKRTWLKAADVCDRAQVQPYVLRTWEIEFADLGVVRNPGGPRMYRPSDLERVLRIKQLVFVEGLTLAGARRKLEEERQASDELPFDDEPETAVKTGSLGADARRRVTAVRNGLRALLTMLSRPLGVSGNTPVASPTPAAAAGDAAAPAAASRKTTTKRRKAAS